MTKGEFGTDDREPGTGLGKPVERVPTRWVGPDTPGSQTRSLAAVHVADAPPDSIDHTWMLRFLEHRIADRRILRLIRKWLRAGISEDGQWSRLEKGTSQGSVISPLLANVYLHYSLDQWVQQWRKQARGDVIIVRYADWSCAFNTAPRRSDFARR